jgi:hypothetical protein
MGQENFTFPKVRNHQLLQAGKYYYIKKSLDIDDDELQEFLYEIREYKRQHYEFKSAFVDSVLEFVNQEGFISANQYNILVEIYYFNNMHIMEI